MSGTAGKTISVRAIVIVIALVLAVALALNWYNGREQDSNTDRLVDQVDG